MSVGRNTQCVCNTRMMFWLGGFEMPALGSFWLKAGVLDNF